MVIVKCGMGILPFDLQPLRLELILKGGRE
jgi:hypothetical protein